MEVGTFGRARRFDDERRTLPIVRGLPRVMRPSAVFWVDVPRGFKLLNLSHVPELPMVT